VHDNTPGTQLRAALSIRTENYFDI